MSLSGNNTGAQAPYTARQMMEAALRRCGVPAAKWGSETVAIATDTFNTMMTEMLNLGMQLWGRDKIILPLYMNRNEVPCPMGTSVVISANQRSLSRVPVATPIGDAGGDPALAFDDDFATGCHQVDPNGYLGAIFPAPYIVTTIGILFDGPGQFGIMYEHSLDGTNWVALDAATVVIDTPDPQWFWYDVTGAPAAIAWRIRTFGVDRLKVAELYFGFNPQEIPMGMWSLDDWNAMTVKSTPGVPWNWYQQRDLDVPRLYIWPMPDATAKYMQMVCYRRRHLNDITNLNQDLDIPRRWQEAMTCSLARRLCLELPEADMTRFGPLNQMETAAMMLAAGEERDPAPIRYNPGLEVYKF